MSINHLLNGKELSIAVRTLDCLNINAPIITTIEEDIDDLTLAVEAIVEDIANIPHGPTGPTGPAGPTGAAGAILSGEYNTSCDYIMYDNSGPIPGGTGTTSFVGRYLVLGDSIQLYGYTNLYTDTSANYTSIIMPVPIIDGYYYKFEGGDLSAISSASGGRMLYDGVTGQNIIIDGTGLYNITDYDIGIPFTTYNGANYLALTTGASSTTSIIYKYTLEAV